METPKLYYLGEGELTSTVIGTQGAITPQTDESNQRGENSTDFQFVRENPERVAAGSNSFIAGGQSNQVNGNNSFAAAGFHNEIQGNMSFASGEHNSVLGNHSSAQGMVNEVLGDCSHAAGSGNYITGELATANGDGNIVCGYAAHAEGGVNICDAPYSHAEGLAARPYNDCQHAKASGGFSNPGEVGEAQYTNIIARIATEDDSQRDLIVSEDKTIVLMNNKVNAFRIMVVASSPDQEEAGSWEFRGIIRKKGSPSSTLLMGALTKTIIAKTRPDWDVQVSADTQNGSLRITAAGEAGMNIRWVAFVEMVEVAFYS